MIGIVPGPLAGHGRPWHENHHALGVPHTCEVEVDSEMDSESENPYTTRVLVPGKGIEPLRAYAHSALNAACLPVPPSRHGRATIVAGARVPGTAPAPRPRRAPGEPGDGPGLGARARGAAHRQDAAPLKGSPTAGTLTSESGPSTTRLSSGV